jgi:hypothetical protein
MALPTLTPEQRQAALAKASQARKARSELLAALKSGAISMTEVLAREDDVAKKTKVAAAVKALPGYGPAKAAAVRGASNNGTASGVSWSASFLLSMWRRAGVIRREHAGPGQAPSLRVHQVHDRLECGHLNWPRLRVSGVDGT